MKLRALLSKSCLVALLLLFVLGAAIALWSQWGASQNKAPAPEKLAIGVADAFFTIPVLVAEDRGFLRDAGLDATFQHFPSGKAAMDIMLKDGSLDVVTVSGAPIALAALRHLDITAIGNYTRAARDTKTVAHPNSGISSVLNLRGKRIGIPFGTIADYCLNVQLTDDGLSMDDIVRVPLGLDKLADALAQQTVDAVATYEPYGMYAIDATGGKGLVLNKVGRCVVTTGYISKRAFPKERKEAVRRLLIGTELAIVWMQSHRIEAIAVVARKLNIDPKTVDMLWDSYNFGLSLEQSFLNSLDAQAQWIVDTGMVPATPLPNMLEYVDLSVLTLVAPNSVSIIH